MTRIPTGPARSVFLLGRGLQVLGLVLLPLGLYAGVVHGQGMTVELTLLASGVACFLVGGGLLRPFRKA